MVHAYRGDSDTILSEIFFYQVRDKIWWSIKECQREVTDVEKHLLFIHAWSEFDSMSSIVVKGKPSILKLLKISEILQSVSEIMSGIVLPILAL